ncbi:transcription factor HES-5-like [Coregonus clupeaformis]|uniref:transcription factor HES-5-like n=1 Tax=Coregonus clupeaformis TaxID=59861 RepID=UPI001E1C47A2|nr:transcription factor HES-5-like [Coregonus clupeaformis]
MSQVGTPQFLTAMAPFAESNRPTSVENSPCSSNNKLRKLIVEKIRRDRINSSIEQLRKLLHGGQICGQQQQQRSSNLEKADILELAVSFLQKETTAGVSPTYSQGCSQCLQETLRHLSLHAPLQAAELEEIKRFYVLQKTALSRRMSVQQ